MLKGWVCFFDLGDFNLPGYTAGHAVGANNAAVGLTSVSTAGEVVVYDTDTTSNICLATNSANGGPCNLNGLAPPLADPDLQWEVIFTLADQGYDGIQTFSFSMNDFGLDLTDFGRAGVRSQVLYSGDDLLPKPADAGGDYCGGSDKSYGDPGDVFDPDQPPPGAPVPGTLLLFGLGLLSLKFSQRKAV